MKGVEGEAHESVRPQRNQHSGRGRGGGRGRGRGRGGGRGGSRAESRADGRPDGAAGDNTQVQTVSFTLNISTSFQEFILNLFKINEDGSAAPAKPKNSRPRRNRNRNKNKNTDNKDKPAEEKEGTKTNSDEVQKLNEKVQKLDVAAEES